MWLFSKTGFFSFVQKCDDKNVVIVRARVRKDLCQLIKKNKIQNSPIKVLKNADYPYRIEIPRSVFTTLVAREAVELDYYSFREDARKAEPGRANLYMNVWRVMYDAEEKLNSYTSGNKDDHAR